MPAWAGLELTKASRWTNGGPLHWIYEVLQTKHSLARPVWGDYLGNYDTGLFITENLTAPLPGIRPIIEISEAESASTPAQYI